MLTCKKGTAFITPKWETLNWDLQLILEKAFCIVSLQPEKSKEKSYRLNYRTE